ncbi:fasciclin domain-containing protein [Ferruginibacter sp. HRS2-29]|uniref:fasciclin domain-containing protein n=1 Tax=Ferruginibacter sp. HRS2-29 TaxID=2487334 RepID=UPI0020CD9738|nr:fasciclin domain-containing protein [Ferruginibacter sp. HRS2-29]MCP9752877.1 fasciclin domain-containing protein [Ferruginibacter sp. HRS2-29]
MKKNLFSFLIVASVSTAAFTACNDAGKKEGTDSKMSDTTATTKMEEQPKMAEEKGVMVGGANMVASKNIVENAAGSADHTTLVAAVKAAGLAETLSGAGPFTVFAPTNEAFNKVPKATLDALMTPEKKADLAKILTYHVVSGALKSTDLKDGQKLKTVQGEELTIGYKDGKWSVKDAKGNSANITIADVISSNGVTYVIDGVLMPK